METPQYEVQAGKSLVVLGLNVLYTVLTDKYLTHRSSEVNPSIHTQLFIHSKPNRLIQITFKMQPNQSFHNMIWFKIILKFQDISSCSFIQCLTFYLLCHCLELSSLSHGRRAQGGGGGAQVIYPMGWLALPPVGVILMMSIDVDEKSNL